MNHPTPKVAAVICARNPPPIWRELAKRLIAQPFSSILIIDDGSDEPLALPGDLQAPGRAEIVRMPENSGLAAARNQAIKLLDAEWILFVDSDVLPSEEFLADLPTMLEEETADGLGFHVREHNRHSDWDCYRACERDWRKPSNPVEWLSGLLTVYRRSALEAVGGFDPAFRTNGEDVDLGYRLTKRGSRLRFVDELSGEHHRKDSLASFMRMHWRYAVTAKRVDRSLYVSDGTDEPSPPVRLFHWKPILPLLGLMVRFTLHRPWALYVPTLVLAATLGGAMEGRRRRTTRHTQAAQRVSHLR